MQSFRRRWTLGCGLLSFLAMTCAKSRVGPEAGSSATQSSPASATPAAPSAKPAHAPDHHEHAHASGKSADAGHEHQHDHGRGYHMDFSEVERFAKHFDGPERDAWQLPKHVVELMATQPGHIVADIGAGTGYFIGPLSQAVGKSGRVLGLDVEPNMVEYMRRRAAQSGLSNVEARVVPGDDPKLPAASVDRILIVNTWHHIDRRPEYAKKLADALRANGAIFIVDFTKESDIGPPSKHRLTAEEVVAELTSGGLAANVIDEKLSKQYVVRASAR